MEQIFGLKIFILVLCFSNYYIGYNLLYFGASIIVPIQYPCARVCITWLSFLYCVMVMWSLLRLEFFSCVLAKNLLVEG